MKQPSDYGKDKESDLTRESKVHFLKHKKRSRKKILIASIVLLAGISGGLAYGWLSIQRKLIPLIQTELTDYLHRPIEIGQLTSISPLGIRFGKTNLPATDTNPDRLIAEAIRVNFSPWQFLLKRELVLHLTIIKPDVYIEQDERGIWTPTDFGTEEEEESDSWLEIEVKTLSIRNADVTLVARSETKELNPPVPLKLDRAKATFLPEQDMTRFEVAGKIKQGGRLKVKGKVINDTGDIDLNLVGKKLAAQAIANLVILPLELQEGKLDSKLDIKLPRHQNPQLSGTANLDEVQFQLAELAKPFTKSKGRLRFDGYKIEIDRVSTWLGEVPAVAEGVVDTEEEGNYQIEASTKPVEIDKVIEALELEKPEIAIDGKIKADLNVTGVLLNPQINVAAVTTTNTRIDKVDFKAINANLDLIDNYLWVRQFTGTPQVGGQVKGTGRIQLDGRQNLFFDVQAQNVPGNKVFRNYNDNLPIEIGLVSGSAKFVAQADDLISSLQALDGEASFPLGGGTAIIDNFNYLPGGWQSEITTKDVDFASLPIGKNSAENIGKGKVNTTLKVTGNKGSFALNEMKAEGIASLTTVGGKVDVPNLSLAAGRWVADANTSRLNLNQVFPELPPEFDGLVTGTFELTGNVEGETEIDGVGNLNLAEGEVAVTDLQIRGDAWQAKAQANNLKLKELNSETPDQFAGLVDGTFELSGDVNNIVPEAIIAKGDGSLTLPEGVFAANNLVIADGRFTAVVIPQGVDLSLFADPGAEDDLILNGELGGKLNLTGKIDRLSPPDVQAIGNVTFSEGIDLLEQPFSAAIEWDGKRLDVLSAEGEGLEAKGYINIDKSFFSDIPDKLAAVNYFYFDVPQAKWIDINKLRLTLPSWAVNLDYSGRADFQGKIAGIPSAMEIDGGLILRDFRVENLAFNPILAGKVAVSPQEGANLQLSQDADEISLILDRDFLPISFALNHGNMAVTGRGKGEILTVETTNIPVELLKTIAIKSDDFTVPENLAVQQVEGDLSGEFFINLNTLATSGKNIVIDRPIIARIRGDRLTGDFQYADGYLAVEKIQFQQRESLYAFTGRLIQKEDDLEVQGEIDVEEGKIQDVLVALEIFELGDLATIGGDRQYGKSKDLYNSPLPCSSERISQGNCTLFDIGLPEATIFEQLNRLAEIQAWLNLSQQNREQRFLLPDLKILQGNFNGQIVFNGSLAQGINTNFDFKGQKWQWGKYNLEKVIAEGNLREGILTLLPISVQSGDSLIAFSGSFGGETQSGQFRLINVPIEPVEELVNLPPEINFGGTLNATATIAGTQANPQARGEITVANATVNQTAVEETRGSFSYNNSRLNFFASSEVVAEAEPITLFGSIPYQLPFAETKPDSDRLNLQLNVQNEGLALLNILSRQEVNWIEGEGEVTLDIKGIFDREANLPRQLVAKGVATVNNGKIAARFLPDAAVTEINGKILFDFDRIQIENLIGNFGGGQIRAFGSLPLTNNTSQTNPINFNLDDVAIDLKGLYDGGLRGNIQILGSAIEPDITGELTLFDGEILTASTTAANTDSQSINNNGIAAATEYKNLELNLGKNIQIVLPPIFNFHAQGTLKVNGTFNDPRPEGTIDLQRGQVNLFTTQLSLKRDEKNTARFYRKNGLDPYLDVNLVGSALETSDSRIPEGSSPSEIKDLPASSLGSLQTVRIFARVEEFASRLTPNKIELTSSPPRSQTEIVALLGGSFVTTLGRGDSTLGLANLAGSALFGTFNNVISDAFGLSEFRLFPTQIIDEDEEKENIVGLAGEIAFDITDNISISALRILNADIPAQFGLLYRLNDNFVLRGSSNFEDESRFTIEYELNF
ncbi:MAG: translocation/assembly module TamB domain-containing protein [Xenococcaceae cyanobacterium MO_188.B29]|nr:translocation/assembly module TamB domain-containing protein [Xenococcaceae cyanobacterium MO_188.B29]